MKGKVQLTTVIFYVSNAYICIVLPTLIHSLHPAVEHTGSSSVSYTVYDRMVSLSVAGRG